MACDLWRTRLDAFVDGELPAAEASELDTHLRDCPLCAADAFKRAQWKRLTMLAGRRFSADTRFRQHVQQRISRRKPSLWIRRWAPQVVLAAAILAVALFAGNRWLSFQRGQALGEIVDLHVSALASQNPVDVASSDRHTVKPWFTGKLPFTFNLPELAGSRFTLAGGRLAYFDQAPAAQLIFGVRQHRVSVFVLQERSALRGRFGKGDFVAKQEQFNVRTWSEGGLRYFAISDASAEDIAELSALLQRVGT